WNHRESREVDHVIGAFFLVRRSLYKALDGFDERFFVSFEDLDFSCRAEKAGWRSYYLATVQAYHKGGGTSEQIKSTRLFYTLRSRILYGYKHLGWWVATGLMLGTLLLEPLARIGFAIVRGSFVRLQETVGAYAMLWMTLPRWIMK
ncbi:MAG: glycosyltransferase family 2 protein, partial [Nitrospiria bacterium]